MLLLTLFALGILMIDLLLPKQWKRVNAITALIGIAFSAAAVGKLHLRLSRRGTAGHRHSPITGFMGSLLVDRFAHLLLLPVPAGRGHRHPDVDALSRDRAREPRRVLRAAAALRRRHDVHGRRLRHRADLHRPGVDGHLDLRAGRLPAPRQALERSRAEVSAAGRVLVRNLRLRPVAVLRTDRQHQPRTDRAEAAGRIWQPGRTIRSSSSRCWQPPPGCCSRLRPCRSISGRPMPTKARPPALPDSCRSR